MQQKIYFTNNLGIKLAGILNRPNDNEKLPLVVICHGMGSSKESSACVMLAEELNNAGIASFRFDFTCQGQSEGSFENITLSQGVEDLKAAIETLNQYSWIDFKKLCLFGRSFGGNVVIKYLAENDNVKFASLNAPASDLAEVLKIICTGESVKEWERTGVIVQNFRDKEYKLSYNIYLDALNNTNYEVYKNTKAKLHIVHGSADETVPLEQSIKLKVAVGENAELLIIDGVDHKFNPGKMDEAVKLSKEYFVKNLFC